MSGEREGDKVSESCGKINNLAQRRGGAGIRGK